MGRKIVSDDVDLLPRPLIGDDLAEKGDELLAGMRRHGLAQHSPLRVLNVA
jgi:hypothetical protein